MVFSQEEINYFVILKYIIIENSSPIIFGTMLLHSDVAKPFGQVKSTGFGKIGIYKKEIKIKCVGESSTLNIPGNPEEDEERIRAFSLNC